MKKKNKENKWASPTAYKTKRKTIKDKDVRKWMSGKNSWKERENKIE